MAINTQTIRIDLNTGRTIPVAFAHQNDTNRQLTFQLYNNGVAFTPSSTTVKFAYKSPIVNGRYSVITGSQMASGTVSGNTVTVTLPSTYTAISGVGMLTMIITTSGNTLRPVNIKFVCQGSADGDDQILNASDWPEGLYDYMDNWLEENEPTEIANLKSDLLELQSGGYVADQQRIGEKINDWLDDHPEATTTVQDGSLTEEKFSTLLNLKTIKDYVTPEMYGAKGDGTTDDTTAVQTALNNGNYVVLRKTYLIASALSISSSVVINGNGVIKASNSLTGNMISISTGYIRISNIRLTGNNNCNGIVFTAETNQNIFENVKITNCDTAWKTEKYIFMTKFSRCSCQACEKAFCFNVAGVDDTSLTFENCWAQNCGDAYLLENCVYASFINCGADYCNYKRDDNPYGDGGHGNKASLHGIYDIRNCRGVSIINCGTEYCYGRGAVYVNNSIVTIDGLVVYGLKTALADNINIGFITTGYEVTRLNIQNCYFEGFERETESAYTKYLLYNNFSTYSYGELNYYAIFMNNTVHGSSTYTRIGGYNKSVKDDYAFSLSYHGSIDCQFTKTLETKRFETSANKIIIPFISYTSFNLTHYFDITIIVDNYNQTSSNDAIKLSLSVVSLTTTRSPKIIECNDPDVTLSTDGLNLIINLPSTYNRLLVQINAISDRKENIDFDNISISAS